MIRRAAAALLSTLLVGAFVTSQGVANASVSSTSAATPQIGGSPTSGTDGTIEVVRQLAECGGVMDAVGRFPQVRNPGSSAPLARGNAFSFGAVAPHTITPWNPDVNGQVDTVTCGADLSYVLLGSSFSAVRGVAVRNLAKVDTATGAVLPFAFQPAGRANTAGCGTRPDGRLQNGRMGICFLPG